MTHLLDMDTEEGLVARLIHDVPFMGMALLAPDSGQCLQVNDRLCEILGYSRRELLESTWSSLTHTGDPSDDLGQYQLILTGEREGYTAEMRLFAKDTSGVEATVNLKSLRRSDGSLAFLVATVSVSGEYKLAERALRAANERLTRAQRAAGAGVWDWDITTERLDWSDELFHLFGLDPVASEASFETWRGIVHADDIAVAERRIQVSIQEQMPLESEYRIVLPSREIRWIHALGDTTYDADGRPLRMSGICLDITARKRAEAVQRAERDTSQRYLDTVEAIIVALDSAGCITLLNRKGHALLGYASGELDGANWFECCLPQPEGKTQVLPVFRQLMSGELANVEYFENPVLTRAGERRLIAWHNTLLHDDAGRIFGVLSAGEDITERNRAEVALRESEARFRQLADSMPQLVWTADPDGRVDYFNQRVNDYDGIQRHADETWTWQPVLHPDDVQATLEAWQSAVALGHPYQCEHRVRMADGLLRWHLSRGVPVRGDAGHIVKWYGTATDIHDLKLAQGALEEADRRKDEFLAMLAHELRNPLVPIRNAAHVLGRLHLEEPRVNWAAEIIERHVEQLSRLVDDLLDVSRIVQGKVTLRLESVSLGDVVRNSTEVARPLMEAKGHQLHVELPQEPVYLEGDPARLTQVLANLLDNAAKYTPHGGHIALTAQIKADGLEIEVRDNGLGIAEDLLPAVFDLFRQGGRSLDRAEGGLGIGLTLVKTLVELHGGHVEASSPGHDKGATFRVWLPLPMTTPAQHQANVTLDRVGGGAEMRVLVVDDEPVVAESTVVFLEMEGYLVRSAASGDSALNMLSEFQPRVVLLDLGMPGMDGYEVARRIRQLPSGVGIRLLAVSGYGNEEVIAKCIAAGFDMVLAKPVDPALLIKEIEAARSRLAR